MRRSLLFAAASWVLATAVVTGCSTSHATGSPGPSDAGTTCPFANPVAAARPGAPGAGACAACLEAQCASQLAAYAGPGACGDYIACVCPDGVPTASTSAVSACQTQDVESGCVQAATDVEVCQDSSCSSACSGQGGGAGGPEDAGDAAVVGPGGSFVDASLTATCESYVRCCELALEDAGPAATIQTDCEEAASLLTDPQCEAYVVAYQDAGVACSP